MSEGSDNFYRQLQQGPAFLLLGQRHLSLESGLDSFLSEVLRKYGRTGQQPVDYSQILDCDLIDLIEPALSWMQGLCDRLSVPQSLKTIGSFAWSGIYTSAIDSVWQRAFRPDFRQLQPLFEEKYKPSEARSRTRLHCTFLFGCVNRIDELERPPLDVFEKQTRRQIALSLLRRLPELITPVGMLVIEGYAGERDWITPEDLWPVIDSFNPGQIHMFSAPSELVHNPYIKRAVENGKLVLHAEGLATCLLRGEIAGKLKLGILPDSQSEGRSLIVQTEDDTKTVNVPISIWNQTSRSAIILDDGLLAPLPSIKAQKLYDEFRNFLAESSIRPIWSGYIRGFAFPREFEKRLYHEVSRRLGLKGLQEEPVILYGQTGTGKTVALGALAYQVRQVNRHPVLFIERKSQKPIASDLDAFCKWAEDNGALSTLIIWDGMVDDDGEYYMLLQYLIGRGRKVVVVGSCYQIRNRRSIPSTEQTMKKRHKTKRRTNFISAPASLATSEISEFEGFLKQFDPLITLNKEMLQRKYGDTSFLVALYRLLPDTRSTIRTGVITEIGFAEQEIKRKLQEGGIEPDFATTLGYALWKQGLIKNVFLSDEQKNLDGEQFSEFDELIALVMVPGRFGINLPLEVLLRTLGKEVILNFTEILKDEDIFQWYFDDRSGRIVIGPRHPLEAKLYVQGRLGGPQTEISFARKLILEIHDRGLAQDNPEVQFAIDLVRSMGPNGHEPSYFRDYYLELAETLTLLRKERGQQNPRLMLQEAVLIREWVVKKSIRNERPDNSQELLDKAEDVLRTALTIMDNERARANLKLRSQILVDLASIMGSKIHLLVDIDPSINKEELVNLYRLTRQQLLKSRSLDPENYYAIDVLCWLSVFLFKADVLNPEERAEAEADLLHIFLTTEINEFSAIHQERFYERRMQIGQILGKRDISDRAFRALQERGSAAGYYLRASYMAGELPNDRELTDEERQRCNSAVDYLTQHRELIIRDGRCMYLFFKLWWQAKTGKPLFFRERLTVALSRAEWQYCLDIITDLMTTDELYTTPTLKFFLGIANFQINKFEEAFRIFKELERESDYLQGRRRIVRSYLASTSTGSPRKFNGTVSWINDKKTKGEVYVEELRRSILFFPYDFGDPDIELRSIIGEFHIAFNFISLIADPVTYYKVLERDWL